MTNADLRREWGGKILYSESEGGMAVSGKYVDWLESCLIERGIGPSKNDLFAQRMVGFALDRGWKPKEEDLALFMERWVKDLERTEREFAVANEQQWCIVPPNQECECWSVYQRFDGEFGYEDELAQGVTLGAAIIVAVRMLEAASTSSTPHDNPKSDKLTSCPTDSD